MSPARHGGPQRWPTLLLVAAVLVGGALLAWGNKGSTTGGPAPQPGALVSAPDAESSAWYCTGQSTATGPGPTGQLVLTNTTPHAVAGSVTSTTDTGATATTAISVPARSQLVSAPASPGSGSWVSQAVDLAGGGVAVTQSISGKAGWAQAPCQSATSPQWYFPAGSTSGDDQLFIALFNPTSTPDVVDLSFVTPSGVVHPLNFQGLVLQAGQTAVENVAAFVQNQSSVATTVSTRAGRVVAGETQILSGGGTGLALVPGSPRAEAKWTVPESVEVQGGSSSLLIFNPGSTTEHVTVQVLLASGVVSPIAQAVPPDSNWVLSTSAETRILKGDPYATNISATGGPGVVVGRSVVAPSGSPAPQIGLSTAVDSLSAASPTNSWLVPAPGTAAAPASSGALPAHLGLANATTAAEKYVVSILAPGGPRVIASGTLNAMAFASLTAAALTSAGLNPLLVHVSGPAAVSEDVGPTGAYGVVTMPGIPLAAALGG